MSAPARLTLIATLAGLLGCSQAPSYVIVHQPVATVNVTPAFDTIPFGGGVSLKVTTLDINGDPTIPDKHPVWSSLNSAVLRVDTSGNVAAVWNGQGTIRVVVDGVEGDATITVLVPPITMVSVGPVGLTPERGDTVHFSASARNSAGLPAIIGPVTWTSSDTTRLRIDSTGRGIAVGLGAVQVTGSIDTLAASVGVSVLVPAASVTVSPKTISFGYEDSGSFRVTVRDSAGNILTGRPVHVTTMGLAVIQVVTVPPDLVVTLHPLNTGSGIIVASLRGFADTERVTITGLTYVAVAPGAFSTCGLTADSAAYCWGYAAGGQLGNPDSTDGPFPRRVIGAPKFASLYGGEDFNCGLTADGSAWCWGDNIENRLGRAGPSTMVPGLVEGGYHFTMVSTARSSCGVTTDEQTYCWGPDWGSTLVPVGGTGLFDRVAVTASGSATNSASYCGTRAADDSILCWTPDSPTPTILPGSSPVALQANGQYDETCGISGGVLYCWGWWQSDDNTGGYYGFTPRAAGTSLISSAGGAAYLCGITTSGDVKCRGIDRLGGLGDGNDQFSDPLVKALTPAPLTTIRAGFDHTCGMGTDGRAYCWGYNGYGQVGVPPTTSVNTPQRVMQQN